MKQEMQSPSPVFAENEPIPVTKQHSLWHGLAVVLSVLALVVFLLGAYLVLLVGEPDEEEKTASPVTEDRIQEPMVPIEALGGGGVASLPDTFGKPVLILSSKDLQKSQIYDTAYGGAYARRAILSYVLEDGSTIELVSLRPTSAALLISKDGGYTLDGSTLYSLAGMNAAYMENGEKCIVFAQSDDAVYAVSFSLEQADEVMGLLHDTMLLESTVQP